MSVFLSRCLHLDKEAVKDCYDELSDNYIHFQKKKSKEETCCGCALLLGFVQFFVTVKCLSVTTLCLFSLRRVLGEC